VLTDSERTINVTIPPVPGHETCDPGCVSIKGGANITISGLVASCGLTVTYGNISLSAFVATESLCVCAKLKNDEKNRIEIIILDRNFIVK
jgi:hypothetical protein